MGKFWNHWRSRALSLLRSKAGNVATMFALSAIPLVVAGGAGVDLGRAMLVRASMSSALDAAALAVGATPNITQAQAQTLATNYFNANFKRDGADNETVSSVSVTISGSSVTLSVTDNLPTDIISAAGIPTMPITVSSTVVWGQTKLWVSLVLDNSGSMCQPDSQPCVNDKNTKSKIYALKSAAHQLLTTLQGASANAGDVQVAIVPFTREVNVDDKNVSASWLSWTLWEAPPAAPAAPSASKTVDDYAIKNVNNSTPSTIVFAAWGPGDDCPFTDSSNRQMSPFGFYCTSSAANSASNTATIPSSGLICPGIDSGNYNTERNDRYYNGCWSSTKVKGSTVVVATGSNADCDGFSSSNCSCTGKNSNKSCSTQKWTHVWVINNHSTWGGCATDRAQDYDVSDTTPSGATTGIAADNPSACMDATVTPLGYDWTSLSSQIDAMQAAGSTNQSIGVAHGWLAMTPGAPYSAPTVPANTTRYIILLSDGLNTQDRWWGDGGTEGTSDDAKIDARMKLVCNAAKAEGVVIYTLFLDVNGADGDSQPLEDCATDSSKYYDLTSTDQIATAFSDIAEKITNLRVAK